MGVPAYNLVVVKGDKKELEQFEKLAYNSKSEAFRIEQLLPLQGYLSGKGEKSKDIQAYQNLIYGSNWIAAFGVLIEKTELFLKYFFNSKYTKAELHYIAAKYNKLKFTQAFVEITEEKCGIIEYENGGKVSELIVDDENINWEISSDINTYLFIEELGLKLMFLKKRKPEIIETLERSRTTKKYSFYSLFPKVDFLRGNESFFYSIYQLERGLEMRDIDDALNQPAYPLIITPPDEQLLFIEQHFLSSNRKLQMTEDVLCSLNSSKRVTNIQKINTFIYVHRNLNKTDWLYPTVKHFIMYESKKMKLYLIEALNPETKSKADRQWYLGLKVILCRSIDQSEFQGWPGLENEQTKFWDLWNTVKSILQNPETSEISDSDLPF